MAVRALINGLLCAVLSHSLFPPPPSREGRQRGHCPQGMILGLAMLRGWGRGVYVLPLRSDPLTCCPLCSPSMGVCCPGQTCCYTLCTLILCVAAQTFDISQTAIGKAQTEPGLLLPPPSDNFGFNAHQTATKGKGNRAESLNIGQRYTIRKCTDWWNWLWEK